MEFYGFLKNMQEKHHISWRRVWIVVLLTLVLSAMFLGSVLLYAHSYVDRVLPGVYIGDVHIGGMTKQEVRDYIQHIHTKLSDDGVSVSFVVDDIQKDFIIYPDRIAEDTVYEAMYIDIDTEVDTIVSYRKQYNMFADALSALWVRISRPHIQLNTLRIDKSILQEQIDEYVKDYVYEPVDASLIIDSVDPLTFDITTSSLGRVFDYERVFGHVLQSWSVLEQPHIFIKTMTVEPSIIEADVAMVTSSLPHIFASGNIKLAFYDEHIKRDYTWYIRSEQLADWLRVTKKQQDDMSESIVLSLDTEHLETFLKDKVASLLEVEAQDAKFAIGTNGKVVEFQGARSGIGLDMEQNITAIQNILYDRVTREETSSDVVTIVVQETEPAITTSEVNDLGITEILGVGHSRFAGSPSNRIKNIRNAAYNKLHGTLIAPDEEFSLITALQPFTYEGGYLPELVIKGDRIKPEMGGGLCQIGTTMFRAAMNSGLDITERRNHSLVVPYYNDLTNGLPGTDATIYEPHPDFRFKNDTGHYMLITAEMNVNTADLYFYFWGTSDGRKGYYKPPVVSKWIPVGESRVIETTELKPGEKECQDAHKGAVASFVYTRELANGDKIDRVFESYYRPLPQICLVGKAEETEEPATAICEEGDENCVVDSPVDLNDTEIVIN